MGYIVKQIRIQVPKEEGKVNIVKDKLFRNSDGRNPRKGGPLDHSNYEPNYCYPSQVYYKETPQVIFLTQIHSKSLCPEGPKISPLHAMSSDQQ